MDSSNPTPSLQRQAAYEGDATGVPATFHPGATTAHPALRTVAEPPPGLLPDVIPGIFRRLPANAYRNARLVCRDWDRMAATLRVDRMLRAAADAMRTAEAALIGSAEFEAHLSTLEDCHPEFLHVALSAVADLLAGVRSSQRWHCFMQLVEGQKRFPTGQQRWLLCSLAANLGNYLREGNRKDASPSMAGDIWLDAILTSAQQHAVAGQALVLAALCGGIDQWEPHATRPLERLQSLANLWSDQDAHTAKPALAQALRCALLVPKTSAVLIEDLRRFAFYTVGLDAFELRGRSRDLTTVCRGILDANLEPWEKRRLLNLCDNNGVPLLCRSGSSLAIVFDVYEALIEDADELAWLLAANGVEGMPAIHRMLRERIRSYPQTDDHSFERAPHIRTYIQRIASSSRLDSGVKLRLLRGEFRSRPAGLPCPEKLWSEFELGPTRDRPFVSLSVIDSLLCNQTKGFMHSYMEEILKSSLPPALKAGVLRLAYPDRSGMPRMHEAHCLYVDTISASPLPYRLKDELINGTLSDFEAACDLAPV